MPSRLYMILTLVAGACAVFALGIVFGVGVVTAPPEQKTDIEAGRLATPEGVRRHTEQIGADRTLTPIYPASPEAPREAAASAPPADAPTDVATAKPTAAGEATPTGTAANAAPTLTAGGVAQTQAAPAPPEPTVRSQPLPPGQPAMAEEPVAAETTATTGSAEPDAGEPPAKAEPTVQASAARKPDRCDVQACEAAYRSFRASDCTFQPYEGPRRLCTR